MNMNNSSIPLRSQLNKSDDTTAQKKAFATGTTV